MYDVNINNGDVHNSLKRGLGISLAKFQDMCLFETVITLFHRYISELDLQTNTLRPITV